MQKTAEVIPRTLQWRQMTGWDPPTLQRSTGTSGRQREEPAVAGTSDRYRAKPADAGTSGRYRAEPAGAGTSGKHKTEPVGSETSGIPYTGWS